MQSGTHPATRRYPPKGDSDSLHAGLRIPFTLALGPCAYLGWEGGGRDGGVGGGEEASVCTYIYTVTLPAKESRIPAPIDSTERQQLMLGGAKGQSCLIKLSSQTPSHTNTQYGLGGHAPLLKCAVKRWRFHPSRNSRKKSLLRDLEVICQLSQRRGPWGSG